MTASALYEGVVRHRRRALLAGEFRHRITLAYLDLDELPRLLGGRLVRRAPGLSRIRRSDLLGGSGDLRDAVLSLVAAHTGRSAPAGPIRVLTAPRTLGVGFNPVSFYYCFDARGRLEAVVAEVTNTPWRRRQAYVLRRSGEEAVLTGTHAKALHVSPFQPMEREHVWRATAPGATLSVHIENHTAGVADFDATLSLRRAPLTSAGLRRASPLRTLGLIYGRALALKLRGAPHFRAAR